MAALYRKDPDATLDYVIDWSTWLGADTISTDSWVVPTGITKVTDSNTTTTATVWLSCCTLGNTYACVNRIVTAGGRTQDQTIHIQIVET